MRYFVAKEGYKVRMYEISSPEQAAIKFVEDLDLPSGERVFVWERDHPLYGAFHEVKFQKISGPKVPWRSNDENPYR